MVVKLVMILLTIKLLYQLFVFLQMKVEEKYGLQECLG